ncbi:hypothetical protein F4813DRAFT_360352 [Daldinia decipiens]|uniref:uncharacterized protein n=1 Tax=Daldinia decipiens TaxID=326647 RepID=UPI0020C576C6|nr:uncharacterized protein F4813DRAFT_360352 [Daldinia decipiens]KAI1657542.1 hypothetical protein F4813DRAFT_360352 [Daldinia decipiens]
MPVPVMAKVGVVALTVAVAAAVAVYESPELQRMASDLRRRIAIALHALGDSITPAERENLFNRPEDAEGFLRSRGFGAEGEPGVDADDETRRRQREEIMYWNAVREEKKEKERRDPEKTDASRRRPSTRGSSFDDFMQQDNAAEKGAFVFQSGSEPQNTDGLLRRRGEGARGLAQSVYTNPFTDEHGIDEHIAFENSLVDPEKDEMESDIYSASTQLGVKSETSELAILSPTPTDVIPPLISIENQTPATQAQPAQTSERELGPDEFMTAGQDDRNDAYSSIQAWAHDASTASFYSPLPVSPAAPLSDAEFLSEGVLTPTDSASLAGSGEDVGDDAVSARSWTEGRHYDVMSDDEGMMTPASWTEVGSVVSESDAGVAHAAQH